ncbi:MAG: MarR family winged helix-turn-helix transcriptional regulator [Sphingopyxis sp.]|uniref:MarR family winged helix-turn-helix transcriptional regulator n=1 Tax=Sphingopyxis sp. TaxID=1908224 RepID=UPI002ABBFF59|nr:MarR family winged helix-turn-helix transcriptional regulator [Sphingopyxis sp.]MDZ3833762.1 MarR family winged helix-turn-helix transcriptional regulator [Sphingopyxis sp.]
MPASELDDISFLGRLSELLSLRIEEQTRDVFRAADIVVPVRSVSLLTALVKVGEASPADLARALGHSHQLVVQKLPTLLKLGLISQHPDPQDARRKLLRPTGKGQDQLARIEECSISIAAAYRTLAEETGDLHAVILETIKALEERPLKERILPLPTNR